MLQCSIICLKRVSALEQRTSMAGLEKANAAMAGLTRQVHPGRHGPGNHRLVEVHEFGPNLGQLKMLLHVPKGLAPQRPLVVVLHGCTQTAEGYADGAGWLALARRFGFAVLCPQQQERT